MRLTLLLFFVSFGCFAQDQWKNIYSENAWEERDAWQRAGELIRLMNLTTGSLVADIGCNEGYMTFKLAREIGQSGKVYSVDVNQSKLDKLKAISARQKFKNIEIIKGDYDNPKLPPDKLDAVIILDSYHEMDDHDKILQHIKTSLKPGGRLLICEPIAEERRKLSRAEQEKKHEIAIAYVLEDLTKAGFKISVQKDPFLDRTKEKGDKMWVVVAEKEKL